MVGTLCTRSKSCWKGMIQGGWGPWTSRELPGQRGRVKWVLAGRWAGQSGMLLLSPHPWKTVSLNQVGVTVMERGLSQMHWGREGARWGLGGDEQVASFCHSHCAMGSRAKQGTNMIPCLPLTSYVTRAHCFLSLGSRPSSVIWRG